MPRGYKADKAQIWWIAITEFLFFGLGSFVAAARDFVYMSKTADLFIVQMFGGVLVPRH